MHWVWRYYIKYKMNFYVIVSFFFFCMKMKIDMLWNQAYQFNLHMLFYFVNRIYAFIYFYCFTIDIERWHFWNILLYFFFNKIRYIIILWVQLLGPWINQDQYRYIVYFYRCKILYAWYSLGLKLPNHNRLLEFFIS